MGQAVNSIGLSGRLSASLPDPPPPREPAKRTAPESCVGMSVGRCVPFAVAAPLQDEDMNDEPNIPKNYMNKAGQGIRQRS